MSQLDEVNKDGAGKELTKLKTTKSSTSIMNESEKKFRNLIEFAVDGILTGSHEGYITEANSCFCEMCGRKKEELIGKHISLSHLLFTPESVEKAPLRFDLLEKGETVISEREILRPDGSKLMVEMRSKMMPDGTYQSIFRDISEQKKQESRLQKYAAELGRLNADKDLFISTLAHDLSNHFNSIMGFLDILKDHFRELPPKESEAHINMVHKSANTAYSLFQDLLIWIKSQSGVIPFEPKFISFSTICNEVRKNVVYYAANKKITIQCQVPAGLKVWADIQMLKTILRNLIFNAIKFTFHGGNIKVTANKKENKVTVTVSDSGVGIKPDIQKILFTDFNAYSTDGIRGEKGTGLGLLICKIYVEKHKGKIWVESTPGKGSNFMFSIPLPEK